ncbi:magnesium transporter [Haloferax sp. DFSO60]|uniref:magnesium transporter n=1 Tax=Haloferax sp. DFSO60 TaxID=3388652 RepID=UPI00397A3BFE
MPTRTADNTIDGITTTAIPTCHPNDTVRVVLDRLVGETWESAETVYVLDDGRLVGRIDIADIFGAANEVTARDVMERAKARLHPASDRERAVYLAIKADRDEIPVVEDDGAFVGAVTSQTIIDTMHREHLEDVLVGAGVQHTGLRIADLASARVLVAVRSRAPWLLFGVVVGLILSIISSQFEATLRETVALAYFLPVVAYIADSAGTQSEAIAVRAFAVTDVNYGSYLQREFLVGLVVGSMVGILGGIGATFIANSSEVGLVVALSLFVSSTVATTLASLIPIGFITLDVDPALGSGPLATALQDVISVVIYFLFAVAFL